jgi:heterodisulfide reductase subunit A-like polyferredoxin
VDACGAGALTLETHAQTATSTTLEVGSIILAPGFKPYDPTRLDFFGYESPPQCVTSMQFERLLSASGPFGGHLVRPSDHKEPKKIAWLQCVGSRDTEPLRQCLLFFGVLHVRHQGGGDRQGARRR